MSSAPRLRVVASPGTAGGTRVPAAHGGVFLAQAEEDYVACRVLFMLNLVDTASYHLQRCIEGYLKAYILDRGIDYHAPKCRRRGSHDGAPTPEVLCHCLDRHGLGHLVSLCSEGSGHFLEARLLGGLAKVSHLAELPGGPRARVAWCASEPRDLLEFLDEFVFEVGVRIEQHPSRGVIRKFADGCAAGCLALAWGGSTAMTPTQIQQFVTYANDYCCDGTGW